MRLAAAALGVALATSAHAAPTTTVVCDDPERGEVERAIALELPGLGELDETTRIEITCTPTSLEVRVEGASGRAERRLDVVDPARARLAALVATEMLATLLLPPARRMSDPAAWRLQTVAPPEPARAPAAAPRTWRGAVAASARSFPSESWQALGISTVLERDLGSRAAATVELGIEGREVPLGMGTVDFLLLSAAVGPALRLGTPARSVTLGAGVRTGMAIVEGNAPTGVHDRGLSGAWFGPALSARGWFALGPTLLSLGVEGGVVARPVRALGLDDESVAVDGPWLSATLALGGRL